MLKKSEMKIKVISSNKDFFHRPTPIKICYGLRNPLEILKKKET